MLELAGSSSNAPNIGKSPLFGKKPLYSAILYYGKDQVSET
jgi:hypothetical protein